MREVTGGSDDRPFGLITVVLFGSVCCISIPLLIPVIASISLGGVLLAAGVGIPLALVVVVAGIVGARWYRSRAHRIGPGLPVAREDAKGETQADDDVAVGASRISAAPTQAAGKPH